MKNPSKEIVPQFIINKSGKKTAVILDMKTYEKKLDRIEDLYLSNLAHQALAKEKKSIPHEEVVKKFKSKHK